MDTLTPNQSITKSSNCEFMVGKPSLVAAEQLKWVASTDWRFYRRRAALRQYWRETWGLGNFFDFLNYLNNATSWKINQTAIWIFLYWFMFFDFFHLPEIEGKFLNFLINIFRLFLIFSRFLFLEHESHRVTTERLQFLSWVGSNPPINWSLAVLKNFFLLFSKKSVT